jgi:hypothetical protein
MATRGGRTRLPEFKLPKRMKVFDLRRWKHRNTLVNLISPLHPSTFAVTDEDSKEYLEGVIREMDGSGLLDNMTRCRYLDQEVGLFKKCLALGLNPELVGESGGRPSHRCCYGGHVKSMSVLLNLGVDLGAKDSGGRTPLELAECMQQWISHRTISRSCTTEHGLRGDFSPQPGAGRW